MTSFNDPSGEAGKGVRCGLPVGHPIIGDDATVC
ncbi:hypothetical protein EDC02_1339 [Micromonospora sp. Llam0]|nr:hypothetical protein EDC02_1339 [Micromonospora sp. Llam0]